MMTEQTQKRTPMQKFGIPMIAGAITGVVSSAAVLTAMRGSLIESMGPSGVVAIFVALLYVMIAIGVGVGAISPALGAKFLNAEDADELREQKQSLVASAIATLVLGLMLAVLALAGAGGVISPPIALLSVAIFLLIACFYGYRSMKFADELMNTVNRETASVGYYLVFVVIGGWAALAHLGMVGVPKMIDVLSLFWILGLLAAFWVAGKRGMLNRR